MFSSRRRQQVSFFVTSSGSCVLKYVKLFRDSRGTGTSLPAGATTFSRHPGHRIPRIRVCLPRYKLVKHTQTRATGCRCREQALAEGHYHTREYKSIFFARHTRNCQGAKAGRASTAFEECCGMTGCAITLNFLKRICASSRGSGI